MAIPGGLKSKFGDLIYQDQNQDFATLLRLEWRLGSVSFNAWANSTL